MGFETIDDIYAENERARKRLLEVIGSMSDDDHELPTENGKWTVSMVVEHLADVEKSMSAICAKLLSAAAEKGIEHDGKVVVSPHFIEATVNLKKEGTKLEAPEVVQPKGGRAISESVAILKENRDRLNNMKPLFEETNGTVLSFPHPAFGKLTAIDWLVLIGGHENRHTSQIERILSARNAAKA